MSFLNAPYAVAEDATPTPSPTSGTGAAVDIVASDYWLAFVLVLAAIAVIAIALYFAYRYHAKVLGVVAESVRAGKAGIALSDDPTVEPLIRGAEAKIVPDEGSPAKDLAFAVKGHESDATIVWKAVGGDPTDYTGSSFVTTFPKAGTYEISATIGQGTKPLTQKVAIGAPAPTSAPVITIPFVVKNWGRLVIVIFGVGAVSALMAMKALDPAAGVGVLGTLLGVGAVAATSGSSGNTPGSPGD